MRRRYVFHFPVISADTACFTKFDDIKMMYLMTDLLIVQVALFTRYTLQNTSDYPLLCTPSGQKPLPAYVMLNVMLNNW